MKPTGRIIEGSREASFLGFLATVLACAVLSGSEARSNDGVDAVAELEFFEQHVRPLLVERCGDCHLSEISGGLHLGSRQALIDGGDSGPAIAPGDPASSRLIQAVRREGDSVMPPDEPLSDHEIAILEHWVQRGALWPEDAAVDPTTAADKTHWAFQPLSHVVVPEVPDPAEGLTEIDAFVLRELRRAGLTFSPRADRRTLIRRVTYALTGLPPSPEQIERFVADDSPEAYANLVERLLDSPAYGEHLARWWLDLARYSDTKGYVYAREERFWVHAWNYRDWVIGALNEDLPYDRFLMLQIAGDQVTDRRPDDIAAMGFLTLGRRFLGVKHDIIDDRIDVVTRGTMGLTVSCARCHNHKYDPIPTADYYSLYGVFDSSSERLVPLSASAPLLEDPSSEVRKRKDRLEQTLAERRADQEQRNLQRLDDYLWAQTELHKYPPPGFDQIFSKQDLLPVTVHRLEHYLAEAQERDDPLFLPWHAYRQIPLEQFDTEAPRITDALRTGQLGPVNPRVMAAFETPPQSLREVAERYGELFRRVASELAEQSDTSTNGDPTNGDPNDGNSDPAELAPLRAFLESSDSPLRVPAKGIVHIESYFDSDTVNELWKLQSELDQAIRAAGPSAAHALALVDNEHPTEPYVFRRGNPLNRGPEVTRHFLTVLEGDAPEPFSRGSGRLELAQRIVNPTNPLTARVLVNRIWAHHFGTGLVATPSDFGRRAEPPSHPELLDYLARRFMDEGWSLKQLHRWIVLSATYQQDTYGPRGAELLARARQLDPANRLLWRWNPHRLTFEEMRDSLVTASGTLDCRTGGAAETLLQPPYSNRRTIYGLVDRQFLPSTFRVFDFASPDLHVPLRSETTIPQQALFLMNHPMVVHRAAALAERLEAVEDPSQRIERMFQLVLGRQPSDKEHAEALALVHSSDAAVESPQRVTSADWQYGYGGVDEPAGRVREFTRLPHWSGSAWQGGPAYPDPALGWVQLSASGGHPGNDRDHASIRRWTAPAEMTIAVASQVEHQPEAGDGIRAFIISDRQGILNRASVHQQSVDMQVDTLRVTPGETIDFVVDIGDVLNSDQYLWRIEIRSLESDATEATSWNAVDDFVGEAPMRLDPWGQLAQALLCTNEFLFVD